MDRSNSWKSFFKCKITEMTLMRTSSPSSDKVVSTCRTRSTPTCIKSFKNTWIATTRSNCFNQCRQRSSNNYSWSHDCLRSPSRLKTRMLKMMGAMTAMVTTRITKNKPWKTLWVSWGWTTWDPTTLTHPTRTLEVTSKACRWCTLHSHKQIWMARWARSS